MNDIYITPYNFDQCMRLYGELKTKELAQDPAQDYRMKTGIELVYPTESIEEIKRVYNNWSLMSDEMKEKSDAESMRLFGKTNQEHFEELIEMNEQASIFLKENKIDKVCTKCGSHNVVIFIQGEPIYKCKDCGEYLGDVPFPKKKKSVKEDTINESIILESFTCTDSFEDLQSILDTLNQQEYAYLTDHEYIDSPYVIYRRVLKINNTPIAFIELYNFDNDMAVINIACRSESKYRHHGYASMLLEDAIEWVIDNPDINTLLYKVHPTNDNSIRLAKKFQFNQASRNNEEINFTMDVSGSSMNESIIGGNYAENVKYANTNVKEIYASPDAFFDDFKRLILCTETFASIHYVIFYIKGVPVSIKFTAFVRYNDKIARVHAVGVPLLNMKVQKCKFVRINTIGPEKGNDIKLFLEIMRSYCKDQRFGTIKFTKRNIQICMLVPDKELTTKVSKKYKNVKISMLNNKITIPNISAKHESTTEEYLEEGVLNSNLEFNVNQWKIGGKNILFITGLSGSGKSTLAGKLAKENNAIHIELDLIQRNHIVFDDSLKQDEGNLIVREFIEKKFGRETDIYKKGSNPAQIMYDFVKYCISYASKHKDRLFIIEGKQLADLEMNNELANYPVIVVNSGVIKSMIQAAKREGFKDYAGQFHSFNDFMDLVTWYKLDNLNKKKFVKDMKRSVSECVLLEDFEINIHSKRMKPVEALYKQLSEYQYGIVVNGVVLTGDKINFDLYKGLTVKQFEYYKAGVCWDFARYQEYYLKKYYGWVQNFYFILDKKPDYPTHTITVFMINGGFYYIEASWEKYKGIYRSDSLQGILTTVLQRMKEFYNCKKSIQYEIRRYTDNGNLAGMNVEQFMSYMNRRPKVNLEVDLTVDKIAEQDILDLPYIEPVQEETKRSELSDDQFGIPEDRKYPLDTEEHIRSAIKLFGHAEESKKYMLAKRIKKAADNNGIEIPENTQLFKYLHPVRKESFSSFTAQDCDIEHLKELVKRTSSTILRDNIDTIIFDFGAVLVEDEGSEMFKRIPELEEYSEEIYQLVGDVLISKCVKDPIESVRNTMQEKFPEYLIPYIDDILQCIGHGLHIKETTIPLLQELNAKGYKLYYLSNWDLWSYQLQKHVFDELLTYLEDGVFSFEVGCEKPDEKIYHILLNRFQINPNNAIFFDDRSENIQAAINVGIDGILFNDSTARLLLRELQMDITNEWAMNTCNPIPGLKTTKPYVLKVSNEDDTDSTISTKFFAFSPDIISDKYLVVNENAQLELISADKIKDCYIEQYEYVGNKENLHKLEKAYNEGKIVDNMFIYTCLSGKAMLSKDQIDFDESFIKYNTELYTERMNSIQETMKYQYQKINGSLVTEIYAFNKQSDIDIERKYRGVIQLMEDTDGYFFYNKENNYRSKSVSSMEQLTEAMALSIL